MALFPTADSEKKIDELILGKKISGKIFKVRNFLVKMY
jgi:hypothetical protein